MFDKTEKSKKNQGISLVLSEIWGLFSLGQKYWTFSLGILLSILDRQFLVSGYFWVQVWELLLGKIIVNSLLIQWYFEFGFPSQLPVATVYFSRVLSCTGLSIASNKSRVECTSELLFLMRRHSKIFILLGIG